MANQYGQYSNYGGSYGGAYSGGGNNAAPDWWGNWGEAQRQAATTFCLS